jgi:AsmA-like protein
VLLAGAAFDRPTRFHAELTNPIPAGLIVADGTFGPWYPYEPALTKVEGAYTFDKADLSTINGIGGHLDSTGKFTGRLEQISVKGETRTPDFTLDIGGEALPLNTTFTAIVDGTNGDTILDNVSATLGHTPLQARGGVVHMGEEKDRTVELDVRIDNGRLEDVLRLALKDEPPAMLGGLHLDTHLELPPGQAKVPLRLKLKGHFGVTTARFTSNTVQAKIDELSRRGRGAPGDTSVANVASRLRGAFVLGGGVLSLSHVSFAVRGADIQMAGRYRLVPGTVDFAGTARLDAHVSEMVTGWKRLPLKILDPILSRDGAGTVLPISVTGPASKPDFKVEVGKIFHRGGQKKQ